MSVIFYPNPPEGGGPVAMTGLYQTKTYWFTNIQIKVGGKIHLKWLRPWDSSRGHGYKRAIHVDWERREVEFNNGRFVLFDKNPDED